MDFFSKQLFCVVRINCFRVFLPVTVLVTVDGNSRVVFARGGGGMVKSEFCRAGEARLVVIVVWSPGRGRLIF